MLRAICLKEQSISLSYLLETLLKVEQVRMRWQRRELLRHTIREQLLVIVQRAYVNKS